MNIPNNPTHTVEVDAPVRVAYNQWTQFEEFPRFMQDVELVKQIDDDRLRWTVENGDGERRFETVITEQERDRRLAWKTEGAGADHAPVSSALVTFDPIDDDHSRVTLQMELDPQEFAGSADRRVQGDLERFAALIPDRLAASSAWRGAVSPYETGLIRC